MSLFKNARVNPVPYPAAIALGVALGLATLFTPSGEAKACGGFFCSAQAPVVQAGEQILFSVQGNQVTAHVRIQYSGPSESFSWVLPLPTVPEVGVGSELVFEALGQATDPRFEITWDNPDNCWYRSNCDDCAFDDVDADGFGNGGSQGEVQVVSEGAVGPYDYKVIQSNSGEALFQWLLDNGYDQPPTAAPIVDHYAGAGFVFVALKLQKDKSAGEIQPVTLKYNAATFACIPLKLTSIAAQPDMPITNWILAEARAIPLNYFHVVLNAKAYDWLNCGQSPNGWGCGFWGDKAQQCADAYVDLVSKAVDTAAGRAFVTEFAGETDVMDGRIWMDGRYDLDALKELMNAADFMQQLLWQGFPRTALMQELIRTHIPKPDPSELPESCKTDNQFYANWNLAECLKYMPEGWTFDPGAFVADISERIVEPLIEAQAMFDSHGYMTRVFTTMDGDEMIRDPMFSFNAELPDVSNVHSVVARATCSPEAGWIAEKIELEFEAGEKLTWEGEFQQCAAVEQPPLEQAEIEPQAAIQVLNEEGGPENVLPEDVFEREAELAERYLPRPGWSGVERENDRNERDFDPTGTFSAPRTGSGPPADSGCAGGRLGGGPIWMFGALVVLGLLAWRRRERA